MAPAPPWRAALRGLALCLLLSGGVAAWGQGSPARSERLLPLEVFVNGAKSGVWTLLDRNGLLYAPADAFEEWRLIRSASGQSVFFQGQDWHPLSAIPGFEARLNFANQSIDLVFYPAPFHSVRLTREADPRPPLPPALPA